MLNSYDNMAQTFVHVLLVVMSHNESECEYVPHHDFSSICLLVHKPGVKFVLGLGSFHLQLVKLSRRETCADSSADGSECF
jgi:hypothetical protein